VIVQCHLRQFRGDRTLQALADQSGVSKGQLSQIEQGRSLPRDRDVPLLERAYGHPRSEWYPADVAGVLAYEGTGDPAIVSEVWMPRSGRLRRYPLELHEFQGLDGRTVFSKGHHDADHFLAAVGVTWPADVRQEWWATRQGWDMTGPGGELTFLYQPVDAIANGAYPVTAIDL
jgi:transcriptional regulator with XRE-family HTH domain